jgi:perosamine synthetase
MEAYKQITDFIKTLYPHQTSVILHAPVFTGNEKKYLLDCIDSTFVSYLGAYVTQFEEMTAQFTGAAHAIAVVNGTAALQVALEIAGVRPGDEVITQALTFAATASAIVHAGAEPVFVDVDRDTLGMSPEKLEDWLQKNTSGAGSDDCPINQKTGRRVAAVVPMHTFGHPCRIDEIQAVAEKYHLVLIEDSAESLGSYYKGKHTGTFGLAGILSYNGNKTVTTGGGGMILTSDDAFARRARHITTTAKLPHRWEYAHDEAGYNYRLTNVSAAIGVAQMEKLPEYLKNKRETAEKYEQFCREHGLSFVHEPEGAVSNYWLNAIIMNDRKERDAFLEFSNDNGVATRPIWRLMNKLDVYRHCQRDDLADSQWVEDRIVNIPSGVRV